MFPQLIAHISTGEQNPDGTPKKWCDTLTYDTGPNGEPLDGAGHQAGVRRRQDSRWRVQVHPSLRGQAHRPAGRDDEPGLLQLRDRDPWCRQRAVGAGVARLRAAEPDDRQDRSRRWSPRAIWCMCGARTARSPSSTAGATACRRSTTPTPTRRRRRSRPPRPSLPRRCRAATTVKSTTTTPSRQRRRPRRPPRRRSPGRPAPPSALFG